MIEPQHLLHIFRQRLKELLCCALVEGGRLPFIVLCTIRPRLRRRCRPLAAATAALPLILQAGGHVVIGSAAMQLDCWAVCHCLQGSLQEACCCLSGIVWQLQRRA